MCRQVARELREKVGLTPEIEARMAEMCCKMAVHFTEDGVIEQFKGNPSLHTLPTTLVHICQPCPHTLWPFPAYAAPIPM